MDLHATSQEERISREARLPTTLQNSRVREMTSAEITNGKCQVVKIVKTTISFVHMHRTPTGFLSLFTPSLLLGRPIILWLDAQIHILPRGLQIPAENLPNGLALGNDHCRWQVGERFQQCSRSRSGVLLKDGAKEGGLVWDDAGEGRGRTP
jgi:hypothetical protein